MLQEKLKAHPLAELPDDFIPPLKTMKVTQEDPHPILDRCQVHQKALDKRPIPLHGTPVEILSVEDFQLNLDALRRAAKKWGEAKIESFFVKELERKCPDLRLNGREIASTDDLPSGFKSQSGAPRRRRLLHSPLQVCGVTTTSVSSTSNKNT